MKGLSVVKSHGISCLKKGEARIQASPVDLCNSNSFFPVL